jgi:tetratricopeptide (TPR) repeat protein/GTPase SAR1 family protein
MNFWKRLFGRKDGKNGPPERSCRSPKAVNLSVSVADKARSIIYERDRREVRVFISSTFRDMMQEREVLVKKVFPQLRKLCSERFVAFSEVDLRWGITDEQRDEGKVLPLCLAEIERCRPFFVGILGERYGWVPRKSAFTKKLLSDQPWLAELMEGTSVTELEIIHGVLADHAMRDRAFFYFRDPERSILIEEGLSREPGYLPEPDVSISKLKSLKNEIKLSGHTLTENYPTPEAFGQMVLEHLTKAIELLYPEASIPSESGREAAAQESYAIGKRFAYVERPRHTYVLDQYADIDPKSRGLVLFGESGCGKTSLLADWTEKRRRQYPEEFLIQHYLGATPESASAMVCVRRLLGELKERYNLKEEIPSDINKLRNALPVWLGQTLGKGKIVIVLDGLNQLEGEERDIKLDWLPRIVPPNVRIIASALVGPALEELRNRDWHEHEVPLVDLPERKEMIRTFLQIYRKELKEDFFTQLAETSAAANPLYLRTVLEELRVFGSHEMLPQYMSSLLTANGPAELFRLVIQRWRNDYGLDRALVSRTLKFLWGARQGLSEHEWMELLELEDNVLPRIEWTPLLIAMEPHLNQRVGLYTFGHTYLREAVEAELVHSEEDRFHSHLMIANYFGGHVTDLDNMIIAQALMDLADIKNPRNGMILQSRVIAEYPWQLMKICDFARLVTFVSNDNYLFSLWRRDKYEVREYWAGIEANSSFRMNQAYRQVIEEPNKHIWVVDAVNALLFYRGGYESDLDRMNTNVSSSSDNISTSILALARRANALIEARNYDGALHLALEVEKFASSKALPEYLADSLYLQAQVHFHNNAYQKALDVIERQECIEREIGDNNRLNLCLKWKASTLKSMNRLKEAMDLYPHLQKWYEEQNDLDGLAACLYEGSTMAFVYQNDFNLAVLLMNRAETVVVKLGNRNWLKMLHVVAAHMFYMLGDFAEVVRHYEGHAGLCTDMGDKTQMKPFESAEYAVSLVEEGNYEKAYSVSLEAQPKARTEGTPWDVYNLLVAEYNSVLELQSKWRTTMKYHEYRDIAIRQDEISKEMTRLESDIRIQNLKEAAEDKTIYDLRDRVQTKLEAWKKN